MRSRGATFACRLKRHPDKKLYRLGRCEYGGADADFQDSMRCRCQGRGMNADERARGRWWNLGGNFAWAASLFLAGLGAKCGLIFKFGSALPFLDQWPVEAMELFIPASAGQLTVGALFQPHNMHRIFFTRVLDLALVRLNGQWDGLLEMACNAVIHCAGVAGFAWVMASLLGRRSWLVLWPMLVLMLALPFAWENTLWGFQSQFYFLFLFSWLAIWLLSLNRAWSWKWWLGVVMALAADLTMAPGFLASAAVIIVTALSAWKERNWRKHAPTWMVCAVMVAVGLAFKMSVPADLTTQVRGAGEFLIALGKSLAWPWAVLPWYAPFNLFPLLLLGWVCFHTREPLKPGELLIFGMGIWAALQALAGAYARGIHGGSPAWRYMDLLSLLTVANALAGFLLLRDYRPGPRRVVYLQVALACWALGCASGLVYLTVRVSREYLPEAVAQRTEQLKMTRDFIATDDPHVIEARPDYFRLVPNVNADVWLLRQPVIRALLPACARDGLRTEPASNAFISNGRLLSAPDSTSQKCWGSWTAQGAAARGAFESLPVSKSALPYLEIPVAGDLGAPGLSLGLVEENGNVTVVRPSAPPGGQWVNVDVPAPAGPFKVVAVDDSDTKWFAFKEPRELGRWSYWTVKFLACWDYMAVLGLGIGLLNLARMFGKNANAETR
jgi:hypothetical protein